MLHSQLFNPIVWVFSLISSFSRLFTHKNVRVRLTIFSIYLFSLRLVPSHGVARGIVAPIQSLACWLVELMVRTPLPRLTFRELPHTSSGGLTHILEKLP